MGSRNDGSVHVGATKDGTTNVEASNDGATNMGCNERGGGGNKRNFPSVERTFFSNFFFVLMFISSTECGGTPS